ncbi:MAG: MG2 domain-containing protein, partial [Thermoanaerobaculia bacterium]
MLRKISIFLFVAVVLLLSAAGAVPPQESGRAYDAIRAEAEKYYAEKSFARAHALYEEAAKLKLDAEETRWVAFRLADTTWRADAPSPDRDPAKREAARQALDELTKAGDWISAEANESLGDYHATHPHVMNPYEAQRYYNAALDFWAGSDDIPRARRRYQAIAWRMAEHPYRNPVPREVLLNLIKIAETPQERARAQFHLAAQLAQERTPVSRERAFELLDEIVRLGKTTEWYDNALYLWAVSLEDDYPKALELYRRLIAEHTKSESEFVDDAQRAIQEITSVSVAIGSAQTFIPDSEQEILISWRNTKKVELTAYATDLTRDADWQDRTNWVDTIQVTGKPVARRWTYDTNDTGEYRPGNAAIRITPRLPIGAYVVTASGGGKSARTLLLITEAHILMHSAGGRAHVFVSNVETGEPIAGALVRITHGGDKPGQSSGKTNAEGFVDLSVKDGGQMLVTASAGARQAYHSTWSNPYASGNDPARHWLVYAFTDRPAYRPNETVQWKILARARIGDEWQTPANETLMYEIYSPRNEKVAEGTAKLNAFGSFWSELPLTPAMALGEYRINFKQPGNEYLASAVFFR